MALEMNKCCELPNETEKEYYLVDINDLKRKIRQALGIVNFTISFASNNKAIAMVQCKKLNCSAHGFIQTWIIM